MTRLKSEFWVGLFIIAGFLSLVFLAFNVSKVEHSSGEAYTVTAEFDNIGGLRVRAPIRISGVRIGEVEKIVLDDKTFRARVYMSIQQVHHDIPTDSSGRILTEGILGSNYIGIEPGFDEQFMKQGSQIKQTQSAIVLEDLIGRLMYSLTSKKPAKSKK